MLRSTQNRFASLGLPAKNLDTSSMTVTIFLPLIFCCQIILCSLPDYLSYLCKVGSVQEVLAELKASSTGANLQAQPLARHHARHHARRHARHYARHHTRRQARRLAQLCFDEAASADNRSVLKALPNNYPIAPTSLLSQRMHAEMATILLSSNWLFKGQIISGQELFTSHLNEIPSVYQSSDLIYWKAAELGFFSVIKALHASKYSDSAHGMRQLGVRFAADNGHFEIVRYILGLNIADKDWLGTTLIRACGSARSLEFVKILCEEFKVNPNENNGEAAITAAGSGNVDLMEYLISKGLNLFKRSDDAFHRACTAKKPQMAKFLISWPGVDPAENGNRALLTASDMNRQGIFDIIIQDHRVLAALTPKQVNYILGNPSSGKAKLTLLYWLTYNLKEVDMSWILDYKKQMLAHPELLDQYQAVKDRKVAELRANGLDHIAKFIEVWANALKSYAITISASGNNASEEFNDIFDSYLVATLPNHF